MPMQEVGGGEELEYAGPWEGDENSLRMVAELLVSQDVDSIE